MKSVNQSVSLLSQLCNFNVKRNINKTIYGTVMGYEKSKRSSELVAQISTKISK